MWFCEQCDWRCSVPLPILMSVCIGLVSRRNIGVHYVSMCHQDEGVGVHCGFSFVNSEIILMCSRGAKLLTSLSKRKEWVFVWHWVKLSNFHYFCLYIS